MTDYFYKAGDQVLTVDHSFVVKNEWNAERKFTYIFDFEYKTMTIITDFGTGAEKSAIHPFPTVDEALLVKMRDKLIGMGGKPDPLTGAPDAKPSLPIPAALRKGLNT